MNKKKVLLTGASGLIGKEAIKPLLNAGFEVFAILRTTSSFREKQTNVHWIKSDLFNDEDIQKICRDIRPEYLLHFAWYTGKDCLTSELNYKLEQASLKMLEIFYKNGGLRAVYAGTCVEYEFKNIPLKEDSSLNPSTLYAICKNALREQAELYAKKRNFSFGWGRIFYVLGHQEHEHRLLSYIINSLINNKIALIKSGPLIRDYMYTLDIAEAFVKFLDSDVLGCVNICSGEGITIRSLALNVAEKLGMVDLLDFVDNIQDQPLMIVGDNTRLIKDVGYQPQYNMDAVLQRIIYNKPQNMSTKIKN
jgi:nucleoside-diphosphate-sugar epimerase